MYAILYRSRGSRFYAFQAMLNVDRHMARSTRSASEVATWPTRAEAADWFEGTGYSLGKPLPLGLGTFTAHVVEWSPELCGEDCRGALFEVHSRESPAAVKPPKPEPKPAPVLSTAKGVLSGQLAFWE